jgi:dTDP-4-amino-4,6-dideoxygalactose transaminase
MIRLSRSIVGVEEAAAVSRVLIEDGYLGMGAEVQAFERELAAYLGVPPDHVTCVNSGTAALHLALASILEPGDEVLVQSLTFVSTFQAITAAGGVPVACEVLPETFTIDLEDARLRITSRTRAIVPVHYASNPGDLDGIYAFAGEYGLRVIEDAAHAFGCTYQGKRIGSFGDIICFSFDGIKNITAGEGGAIVTSDPLAGQLVRDARLLGVEKDTEKRYRSERSWDFDVSRQGWRYHMSNLFAAVGRVQLRRLDPEFAPSRIALARRYRERLGGLDGVRLLDTDLVAVVPHLQPIRILEGRRDGLFTALNAGGVQVGIHYKPNHLLTYYGGGKTSLPVTEQMYREFLSLPLHPGLNLSDVDSICNAVEDFLKRGRT